MIILCVILASGVALSLVANAITKRRTKAVEESCDILSERNFLLSKRVCELETWLPGQIETVLDTAEDSGTSDAPSQT